MTSQNTAIPENQPSFSPDPSLYFQALMKVKRFAEILLHQQLWLLGKDIKAPNGNLLINYGFEQVRPPKETSGSTNYIVKIDGQISMVLWGYGIYYGYGINKGVYIGRYNVYPKLINEEPLNLPIWAPSKLPRMKLPESEEEWEYSFRLMSELFEWLARYEEWVNFIMGGSYREDCLKDWKQQIVSSDEAGWVWNNVANFFRKNLGCHEKPNQVPNSEAMEKLN